MAAFTIAGLVGGLLTFLQSLAAEGWTRYLVIIFFLGASNVLGDWTGIWLIEGLTETIFGFFGFDVVIPKFGPFSAIFILALFSPVIFFALKSR